MSILLMPLYVYGEGPKIVKVWLGVYRYNGTYYDPLGNTFEGESVYWDRNNYYYTAINYQLDNGEVIRQIIKLNDNRGTSNPAPTVVTSWTAPNGTRYEIFRQENGNTYDVTPLPYETEVEVGSIIEIKMNDHGEDNNYLDGYWKINISENGLNIIEARQSGSHYHNLSFILQNLNRSLTWEIPMPHKNKNGTVYYSGIIPFNGSDAIIDDISGNSNDTGKTLKSHPPKGMFSPGSKTPIRAPIPIGAVIVSTVVILLIAYRRVGEIES